MPRCVIFQYQSVRRQKVVRVEGKKLSPSTTKGSESTKLALAHSSMIPFALELVWVMCSAEGRKRVEKVY